MSAPVESNRGHITRVLGDLRGGNAQAQGQLVDLVYVEMRRIAARHLRLERAGHSLQPTALVHEAYLRLFGQATLDLRTIVISMLSPPRPCAESSWTMQEARAAKRGASVNHVNLKACSYPHSKVATT